jgi:hypothetical protein
MLLTVWHRFLAKSSSINHLTLYSKSGNHSRYCGNAISGPRSKGSARRAKRLASYFLNL